MIDPRHLRHLRAVDSHSTVQAAADALHLTQPAPTKRIAGFEEELGAELCDRRGRRLVLTGLGERLVERGEDLLRHVRELEEEVALWKGIGTGEVAIGVDAEAEPSRLPRVLEAFVPAHPGRGRPLPGNAEGARAPLEMALVLEMAEVPSPSGRAGRRATRRAGARR